MGDFLQRLKQHQLVQWVLAYLAAAWVLLQVLALASDSYDWPKTVMHLAFGVLAVGLVLALVLAWYHGERGAQRVSGIELLIIALVLAVGGGVLWEYSRTTGKAGAAKATAATPDVPAASGPAADAAPTGTSKVAASTTATPSVAPIPVQAIPAKSIAVLPFENLSAEKSNAYFADGIQDLILTKLADIGDLKILSRTSTSKYGSRPEDLKAIGRQLGVATILEGSVQKAGNQVLINVQLIDTRTDSHIWAQDYTRTLDNIFGVEGEVAEKVAKALNAKLTESESAAIAKVPTRNKQAFDAYLRGTYYLYDAQEKDRPSEFHQAITFLQEAVSHDSGFADAWAALAASYRHMGEHHAQAEAAARQALALNPSSAVAHIQMARLLDEGGRFREALEQAQAALRLDPDNAGLVNGLGNVYNDAGRFDAAVAAYTRAVALESNKGLAVAPRLNLAGALMDQRRYAEARGILEDLLAHDPSLVSAATMLVRVDEAGWGDLDSARVVLKAVPVPIASSGSLSDAWYWLDLYAHDYAAARKVMAGAPAAWFVDDQYPLGLYLGQAFQAEGDVPQAKAAFAKAHVQLEAWINQSPDDAGLHATLALVLAGLGEHNAAIDEARRAMALKPIDQFPYEGISAIANMAAVQSIAGNVEDATKLLDQLLSMPAGELVSVALLGVDPAWDPIRKDPRFKALLKKYANATPASAAATSAATPSGTTSTSRH